MSVNKNINSESEIMLSSKRKQLLNQEARVWMKKVHIVLPQTNYG